MYSADRCILVITCARVINCIFASVMLYECNEEIRDKKGLGGIGDGGAAMRWV